MSSESGKARLDALKAMNAPKKDTETVTIPKEDWDMIVRTLTRMEMIESEMRETTKTCTAEMVRKVSEHTEWATESLKRITESTERQVGNLRDQATSAIRNRIDREEKMWWVKLVLLALPLIIVLLYVLSRGLGLTLGI